MEENNIKYMEETIEVLTEALVKLKKLRAKAVNELPGEEKTKNLIKKTADDITEIKKAIVG